MSHQSSLINFQKGEPKKGIKIEKMMMSNQEINLHTRTDTVVMKLLEGKKFTIQLQELIQKPVEEHDTVSMEDLTYKIVRSFTEILNDIKSCTGLAAESTEIAAVDCVGDALSGKTKKVKDRRGCYKRRKTTDSWSTVVSPTMEDCYAWRKYGQKRIMNSENPRCYYRCTHKNDGCNALKQVERMNNDPTLYKITYINHHTCKNTLRTPPLIVNSEPFDPNLISFRADKTDDPSKQDPLITISAVKQESKYNTDEQSHALKDPSATGDAKSTADINIVGFDDAAGSYNLLMMKAYCQEDDQLASGFGSSGSISTCLNDLDMEVDQFDDIDDVWFPVI